jgi:hypothetical protein
MRISWKYRDDKQEKLSMYQRFFQECMKYGGLVQRR